MCLAISSLSGYTFRGAEHVLSVRAPGKSSGAEYARFRSQGGLLDLDQVARWGAGSEPYLLASGTQDELSRSGGTAADGYPLRIEDVHQPRQADAEPDSSLFQDRYGRPVPLLGEPGHVLPEHLPCDGQPSQCRVRL